MSESETSTPTPDRGDLMDNYRPLALPAVAAAFAIKRPLAAVARNARSAVGNSQTEGFWTPSHDDDF